MLLSYQELIEDATKQLYETSDSPRIDAEVLLQHCLNKDLAWIIAHNNQVADKNEIASFNKLVKQRITGTPIAYITGQKPFWTFDLQVNPSVLIPRSDTETLIEVVLIKVDETFDRTTELDILDLGTGSGAIAIALATELPQSQITAVDKHAQALAVACANANDLKKQFPSLNNVAFIQSDWFSAISNQRYHLIVSNPPYINASDKHLDGEIRFEPKTALVSMGEGLSDLEHIIQSSPTHLYNNGWLIVEHGFDQQEPVHKLFRAHGYQNISTHHDLNNLPRVTIGQWCAE